MDQAIHNKIVSFIRGIEANLGSCSHLTPDSRTLSFENQRYRASGLNLVVAAIVLWNTAYLERVVQALRDTGNADDSLLPHLSPLGWEHINLTGDYSWQQNKQVEQGNFRPLPPLTRP